MDDAVDILCRDDDDVVDAGGCIPDWRRLATRWTVLFGSDIWIGGRLIAAASAAFFFSSVDDSVCFTRSASTEREKH